MPTQNSGDIFASLMKGGGRAPAPTPNPSPAPVRGITLPGQLPPLPPQFDVPQLHIPDNRLPGGAAPGPNPLELLIPDNRLPQTPQFPSAGPQLTDIPYNPSPVVGASPAEGPMSNGLAADPAGVASAGTAAAPGFAGELPVAPIPQGTPGPKGFIWSDSRFGGGGPAQGGGGLGTAQANIPGAGNPLPQGIEQIMQILQSRFGGGGAGPFGGGPQLPPQFMNNIRPGFA